MSNTHQHSEIPENSENTSPQKEQKNERIRQRSMRIAAKSRAISERNARTYHLYTKLDSEPSERLPDEEVVDASKGSRTAKTKSGFGAAAILSAISIILLVALAVALMLGLFPSGEKSIVFIPTSNNNATVEGNASSDTLTEALRSVVVVSAELTSGSSTGSGFAVAVSEDKTYDYIATNYHVVANAKEIYVRLYEGDYVEATLVGYSSEDDIAVLKIDSHGLTPLTLADYGTCRLGDIVYALGTPEGENFAWTVTQGTISAVDRILWIEDENKNLQKTMRVLQTDTPVNHGNSGGPLINARGEVLGIVSMKLEENEGMGFALPIDGAIEIISAIIATGSADGVTSSISNDRALLGISCASVKEGRWYKLFSGNITESNAASGSFRADASGVYVISVSSGSAASGKLEKGDIITEINGARIYNLSQLSNILYDLKVGDKISLTYRRAGQEYTVSITMSSKS